MASERNVTRTIIDSKTYQVFSLEKGQLLPLKTIETKGKVSEKKLAKELGVKKVVLVPIAENKVTYGMPVNEFMKYAVVIDEKTMIDREENSEN